MAKKQSLAGFLFRRPAPGTTRAVTPATSPAPLFNLATLQINFAVVGLVVLAAFLTRPGNENAYVIEAHTGQQLVVRDKPEEVVPTLVTLAEDADANVVDTEPVVDTQTAAIPVETPIWEEPPPPVIKSKRLEKNKQETPIGEVAQQPPEAAPHTPLITSKPVVSSTVENGTIDKDVLPQNNDELAASLYNNAVNLLNEGRFVEVEYHLKNVIAKYPHYVKATELLAAIYLEQGKIEDAINLLEQTTRKIDNEQRLKHWLVKLYVDNNQAEKAIDLTKTMLSKQLDVDSVVLLAALYQQSGQNEDAKNLYDTAIELNSSDYKVWLGYALVLENLGDIENARQAYIMAQNLNSNLEVNGFIKSRLVILDYHGNS
jgi:Tfp pilus assembly protein PilF